MMLREERMLLPLHQPYKANFIASTSIQCNNENNNSNNNTTVDKTGDTAIACVMQYRANIEKSADTVYLQILCESFTILQWKNDLIEMEQQRARQAVYFVYCT